MQKSQKYYLLQSPLNIIKSNEKHHQGNTSKTKNNSMSANRHGNKYSGTLIEQIKKINGYYTHKNSCSMIHRNRSKCDTETHLSTKKRNTQYTTSLSKKTIKKRKNTKIQQSIPITKSKISNQKNDQQALTLKSSGKYQSPIKKQLFYSTCFNRNLNQDLEMMDLIAQQSQNLFNQSSTQSYHINYQMELNQLKYILDRTRSVFNCYKSRCNELEQNCKLYKSQLDIANKKIQKLQKINFKIINKSKRKNKSKGKDVKDNIQNTYSIKFCQS